MPAETVQVMVEVTDLYGHVESEPLYVTVQGPMVLLACGDLRLRGFAGELRGALVPRSEERAA
jgi:hypothetical protein